MITFRILLFLALMLTLLLTPSNAQSPQYVSDQPYFNQALNDFWTLQGLGQTTGIKANWSALLGSSDWYEWNSLKISWTNDLADKAAQRDLLLHASITGVNAQGTQAVGYVWPSNGSEFWLCPSPHFDQMPRFVCAVYNDYVWSRDLSFLRNMQPKIEAVMNYMETTMQGRNGLLVCPGIYTGLSRSGPNTTYMDCYREGGLVTWIEEGYYTSLQDMASLEAVLGNRVQAARYTALVRSFPARFDAQLWNKRTHRYAGWKDSAGTLHDYGFTYCNLEALARGLGNADNAYNIFQWLDRGTAQPTMMGGHVGSTDIYQCVVAPRSNTVAIPAADWDPWSVPESLRRSTMGYGALVEDGGALVWVNYYDVMARLKWLDADSAWQKFADMLYRVQGDPLRFTESVLHPTNVYGENYLEVGPADGPENGINGTIPFYGFMGIQAKMDGLFASPNLPTSLLFLTSHFVHYGLSAYTITVSRGRIVTDLGQPNPAASAARAVAIPTATPQPFKAGSPFNTVGFYLTTAGSQACRVKLNIQKRNGMSWTNIASSFVAVRYPDLYYYVSLPVQRSGMYRILLTPATGAAQWYRGNGSYVCRAIYEPVIQTAAGSISEASTTVLARRPFSQILVQNSAHASGNMSLLRKLGHNWLPVAVTWSAGRCGGLLSFADQPAGSYRLKFAQAMAADYRLLSNNYTVRVTNGTASTTTTVAAGGTVRLPIISQNISAGR